MQAQKRTKQEVVSEFRCAEILEAARGVFARKGFSSATVDEIAEAAGLAKGTVYLYFQSKRELYLEALRRGLAALVDETSRNMDAALTAAEKIQAFIATRVRYAQQNRDFMAIYYEEFGNTRVGVLDQEFRNLYLRQAKALEDVLRGAAGRGEIRQVREDAASLMIYEMTRGLNIQRLLGYSKGTADEDAELLFDFVWRGLAPD